MDPHALESAFAEYAEVLLGRYDVGDVLYRLTDQAVEVLGADGAGVSIAESPDQLRFVTASDASASRVEGEQMRTRTGPCHDAFLAGEPVVVEDLGSDDRWPEFAAAALDAGYRAVLGVPMPVRQGPIGALDVYRREPGAWSSTQVDRACLLANMAAGYVVLAQSLDESRTLSQQLQHALDSRVVVEQAKGIVAERHGIGVGEAFSRLREQSQRTNTPIQAVCAGVVSGELRL